MKKYGFTLVKEEQIDEYQIRARLFRHDRTGARLFSLAADDENKVFNITFPTIPENSKGTPHIMEHSVLCGSEKYPVKDPFVELVKGSVNTYVNAGTSSDYTTYPCASTNEKDFYNLIDVYADAVFHPRLTNRVLMQEGWHFDLEGRDGPLRYKGVVFNEMKGAFSSAEDYVLRQSNMRMLAGTGYGHNSGGDPRDIPELDFEEFMEFYCKWYHPSNAYIFFYGDDPEDTRLAKMAGYLEGFEKKEIAMPENSKVSWSGRRTEAFSYPAQESQKDDYYRFTGWLLPQDRSPELLLGLALLEQVLLGTQAAPLRKVLLESGLGDDVTGNGFALRYARMFFSLGLKGVGKENLEKADKLLLDTLTSLAADGIDADAVEAALNTYEFRLRENNTGNTPRGLQHSGRILASWIHDGDPFSPLRFEAVLADIRKQERYFEDLITTCLLDNPDRIAFTAEPDPEFINKLEKLEAEKLAAVKAGLSESRLDEIIRESAELKKAQNEPDSPEALAGLPRLSLDDLDRSVRPISCEPLGAGYGTDGYMHDIFTNGILYLDMAFDLHTVPSRLLPLVPLFCRSLLLMGGRDEDYSALIRKIGIHTGGIRPVRLVANRLGNSDPAAMLVFRTKLTYANIHALKDIMATLLTGINWDNRERFRQILLEEKSEYEAGIVHSGHSIVLTRLRAAFSRADWLQEQFGGISYLHFLRSTASRSEKDWESIRRDLQELYSLIINRNTMLLNVTMDGEHAGAMEKHIVEIAGLVPAHKAETVNWDVHYDKANQILAMPTQVNFIGTGMLLPENDGRPDGTRTVVQKYLRTDYLWNTVRIKGGAYGAMLSYDDMSRIFAMVSYRDPQFVKTFEAYERVPEVLENINLDGPELERIKIGVIGDLDAPLLPDAQGFISFRRQISGISDSYRQEYRDGVFLTTPDHFREFGRVLREAFGGARKAALCRDEVFRQSGLPEGGFEVIKV